MEFIRIKEDIFRLDMITRIREGKNEETFYGRSVRKGNEGWLDIHFIGGEVVKLEGDAAVALRRFLEQSCQVTDLSALVGDKRPAAPLPGAPLVPPPARGRGPQA